MSFFGKLFGGSKASKAFRIFERDIVAVIIVVGSPSIRINESDAIGMYAQKNPSWSRGQRVQLMRTAKSVPPTPEEGLTECIRVMAESETVKSLAPCTILAQTSVVEILDEANGKRSGQSPVGFFTVFRSRTGKNSINIMLGALDFRPDEGRIRTE